MDNYLHVKEEHLSLSNSAKITTKKTEIPHEIILVKLPLMLMKQTTKTCTQHQNKNRQTPTSAVQSISITECSV